MNNHCLNCGGLLRYDIELGRLKCDFCDSEFDVEKYTSETAAKETEMPAGYESEIVYSDGRNGEDAEMPVTILQCPNCGAEISSTELSAVDYCLYCGSFVTLEKHLGKMRRPDYIIPFSKTRDVCRAQYKQMVSKMIYAPKEFREESFLDNFKGIYVPYWCYNYHYGPDINIPGLKETRKGDYIYKQHFNIQCRAEGDLDGIMFDASSNFDDALSSKIAPFDYKNRKDFSPAYMFGFFGDTADVESAVYAEDAAQTALDEMWNGLMKNSDIRSGSPEQMDSAHIRSALHLKEDRKLFMLPVWFSTWRKGDRLAYSVMNGDSGELYAEVPVDTKRYLLFSLLTAIPLFFFLNMLKTFNAGSMLLIAMLLSVITIFLYTAELEAIVRRIKHADDLGFLATHRAARTEAEKLNKSVFASAGEAIRELFHTLKISEWLMIAVGVCCFMEFFSVGAILLVLAAPAYVGFRLYKNVSVLKDKTVYVDVAGSLLALIVSIVILCLDPAADYIYYYAAIGCIVAIGFTIIRILQRYNELITRPVPHFFERKEGGKE